MPLPMPKPSIGACFAVSRSRTANSSMPPLAKILISRSPASSKILRTWRACSAKSPLSMRTARMRDAVARELGRKLHDLVRGGFGVVGVDQQSDVVGMAAREMLERFELVVVRLDERVRHRAEDGHSIERARPAPSPFPTCRRDKSRAPPAGRPSAPCARRRPKSTSSLVGRLDRRARGLAGDHGLEMQQVHEPRFHQLRFRQRRDDAHDRLVGEQYGAFRNRVDVAGEAQPREPIDELRREAVLSAPATPARRRETAGSSR